MGLNAKRRYKIGAVLVCILLVSGVFLYIRSAATSRRTYNEYSWTRTAPAPSTPQSKSYFVNWEIRNANSEHFSDFVKKRHKFVETVSFDTPCLSEIRFILSWSDNKLTFSKRFGRDTLILKVTDPDGKAYTAFGKSARKTTYGSLEINISVLTTAPESFYINSTSPDAARQEVLSNYSDYTWVNQNFTVDVSVIIGEIRPLKRLADKGNEFSLRIIPSYYAVSVTEAT